MKKKRRLMEKPLLVKNEKQASASPGGVKWQPGEATLGKRNQSVRRREDENDS